MKLAEAARACALETLVLVSDPEIEHAYCGDLMSDVMGHAAAGSLWVTIQAHRNSIGVAALKDLAAIVFANDVPVEAPLIEKAREEGINLFRSAKDSFTLCGQLYALGLRAGGL